MWREIFPISITGRKPLDRQAMARAYVAKSCYRLATTSDLRRILLAALKLREICGFVTVADVPSDATLSRAFSEFAKNGLAGRVHDAMVEEYLARELVGHISRDSTAIIGREKPAKKGVKEPGTPRKKGRLTKGAIREVPDEKNLIVRWIRVPKRLPANCPLPAIVEPRKMQRDTRHHEMIISCIWTQMISVCRSAPSLPLPRYTIVRQQFH